MTVRNGLDVPVIVQRVGDVGVPVRVHERGSSLAMVLRWLAGRDELLMPGDVVRWPLGAAEGSLTVADVDPVPAAILHTLDAYVPPLDAEWGEEEDFQPFATVVREIAAAVTARNDCLDGKNFLLVTACDVVATTAISRTVVGHLPHRTAAGVLPAVLDGTHWVDWTTARPTQLTAVPSSARTLSQAAVPPPVVVPPPEPPAPAPAPAPATAVPAPAVVAPVPSPPQVPAPVQSARDWLATALARLAAEQANGNRNGKGNGDGNGRGHK